MGIILVQASRQIKLRMGKIGMAGFEPATSRTRTERAPRLRYIPAMNCIRKRHYIEFKAKIQPSLYDFGLRNGKRRRKRKQARR